jgi:thiosulfate/3-mercaptopyruvate sulfurtransferase
VEVDLGGVVERLVSTEWLQQRLGSPDLCVLDCSVTNVIRDGGGFELRSGHEAWTQNHIPGSWHVDLLSDLSDADAPTPLMMPPVHRAVAVFEAAGIADTSQVVLYDNNLTMWAARVWWMLRAVGFQNAALLDGGWRSWTLEGRPTSSGPEEEPARGRLTPNPRPEIFAAKEEILEGLHSPQLCLVDALQPEVFRGERQDYARPGHIPGAHNVPFADLVDPDTHRYLPPEELRRKFSAAPLASSERVVTYCGGGVAASSAAFALGLIGVDAVSIYDGSLLEWTADPSLPLSTGA